MSATPLNDWSPADHPYAIAVSEAQWWRSAVRLAAGRLEDRNDPRSSPVSSSQIDARNLVLALAQLLSAARLEQLALDDLDIAPDIGVALASARERYLKALPGIQEMRNALTHFDEWSRGKGRGPQKQFVASGEELRIAASTFWGFGYDGGTHTVSLGPYRVEVETALLAAADLAHAIYSAAAAVDREIHGAG